MHDAAADTESSDAYLPGHSFAELERLKAQARLIDAITRDIFREAGILPGMRVLESGSGAGDVAFLEAEMVGETGDFVAPQGAS